MKDDLLEYNLRIDGPLLAKQRELLIGVMDTVYRGEPYRAGSPDDEEHLQGLVSLLDEIADQAHDRHGLDSLMKTDEPDEGAEPSNTYVCDCQRLGEFCSGVPGILAHLENGRLAEGAKVERCDLCRRYASDEEALDKLRELGIAP
jgi:hypothetical protein